MDFLKIEYRHSCDLAGSLFNIPTNTFSYYCFLPLDIGLNTFELQDEGREDGEKNFTSDFKKLQKKYSISTVVPEYLYDCLCSIQLHDTIYVTTKTEDRSRAFNFTIEHKEWKDNVAHVSINFTVGYDVAYGCCNNEVIYNCIKCDTSRNIHGILFDHSYGFLHPIQAGIIQGGYYMVYDTYNRFSLYQFQSKVSKGIWQKIDGKKLYDTVCFTLDAVAYKFYWNGNNWVKYQMLNTIVNSGTNVKLTGFVLPNTWVQFEFSTDGINFVNYGTVIKGNSFANAGLTVSGLTVGVTYYFRFNMFDNNCVYGYSNVLSVVKS